MTEDEAAMDDTKLLDLSVKIEGIDHQTRTNEHRIDALEENMKVLQETQISLVKIANSVESIGKSVVTMQGDIKDVKKSQERLTEKVSDVENRSAREVKKRWDSVYEKLLWLIIGGVAIALLGNAFPKIPW